jgi:tRNA(Glu) U13 pseudouridine synthase TruD
MIKIIIITIKMAAYSDEAFEEAFKFLKKTFGIAEFYNDQRFDKRFP